MIELIAYLAIGALSGVLAGLFGVGGGAVMVPALMLLFGALGIGGDWMAHLAVGTSLATIIGTGAASTLAHHRRGGVRWDIVRPLAPGIVVGALAGAVLAGWGLGALFQVHEAVLALLFAFLAGGVVMNTMKDELPLDGSGNAPAFGLGAVAYTALLLAV